MTRELQKQGILFARLGGQALQAIERQLLRFSDAIVTITKDFLPVLEDWGIEGSKCSVIENWAPIDEIPLRARDNHWSRTHGSNSEVVFLYSGTLGLKHNPDILYDLAQHLLPVEAKVIVISEGLGIERLRSLQSTRELPNLQLLPFQPYECLPDVLAAADVLVVLLERDAGVFSVPSKVLSCLCAARPILGIMPRENLAARNILMAGAGIVVDPGDVSGFLDGTDALLKDEAMRRDMGSRARAFAEFAFDGDAIADRFESLLNTATGSVHQATK
jgi:glycosyltransferase involved in cell wall biosynthesis